MSELAFGGTQLWGTDRAVSIVPVLLVAAVALLLGFLLHVSRREKAGDAALLKLSLFRIPTFAWGNLAATMVSMGEFALIFLLPLYLVNVLGLSALGAGGVLAGMAAGAVISGGAARHLAAKIGTTGVVITGLTLEIIGVCTTALSLTVDSNPLMITALLAIYGAGLGLAAAQLTSTVLAQVPVANSGMGSATQSTLRQLGSAMGAALTGTTLATALSVALPSALRAQANLPDTTIEKLTTTTIDSAGGFIPALEHIGSASPFGSATDQILLILKAGFTEAARINLWLAAGILGVGLLAAIFVAKDAKV